MTHSLRVSYDALIAINAEGRDANVINVLIPDRCMAEVRAFLDGIQADRN